MRKFLVILLICLVASPAEATWSLIENGAFGTATAAGATVGVTGLGADAPIGRVAIVHCSAHYTGAGSSGATTVMSVSDNDGINVYTRLVERTVNNATTDQIAGLFYSQLTNILETTDTVTCNTGNGSSEGKVVNLWIFSVSAGSTVAPAGTTAQGSGTSTSYSTGGIASLSNIERLWLGAISMSHSSGSITCDATFTCGSSRLANTGTALTSQILNTGYLVQTATGDDFAGSISVSRVWNDLVAALEETLAGGATRNVGGMMGFPGVRR